MKWYIGNKVKWTKPRQIQVTSLKLFYTQKLKQIPDRKRETWIKKNRNPVQEMIKQWAVVAFSLNTEISIWLKLWSWKSKLSLYDAKAV